MAVAARTLSRSRRYASRNARLARPEPKTISQKCGKGWATAFASMAIVSLSAAEAGVSGRAVASVHRSMLFNISPSHHRLEAEVRRHLDQARRESAVNCHGLAPSQPSNARRRLHLPVF